MKVDKSKTQDAECATPAKKVQKSITKSPGSASHKTSRAINRSDGSILVPTYGAKQLEP